MKPFAILLAAVLSIVWGGPAQAYYKTITTTGYYSIALDGEYVWGGSAGPSGQAGGAPQTKLWRVRTADAATQMWTLETDVGMKGTVAGIVPLSTKVLVLVSGRGWDTYNGRPPKSTTDPTYVFQPMRAIDGGIAEYDRATGTWSILDVPVYDIEGYVLAGNDLWLSCGDQANPRTYRAYRYNLVTKRLDGVSGMGDSHAIAIEPESDRGFTGTHHGKGLESFALSTMKFTAGTYGDAPQLPITEQMIDTSSPSPAPPTAKILQKPYVGLIKAMVKVDNQLWVAEPMGAFYAGFFGGIALFELPSLKTKWATPSTWQYRDLGDETALDLKLDPVDGAIIWASGAKGLFKLHRTETPPRLEQVDIDGLVDHNIQHIAVDATNVWAGTEQGYLYRYEKEANRWALFGNWRSGFTPPAVVGPREVPGRVQSLSGAAAGARVALSWQAPAGAAAHSYFVSRDDVLVGLTGTASFTDPSVPPGSHTYEVVPNEAPYLKGGLLGPSADASVTVTGTPQMPPDCGARPAKIAWGLGEMVYLRPSDLYVDVYEFPNTKGVYPFTNVTHPQAKQLAAWQGKRLPTHAEYAVIAGHDLPGGGVDYPKWSDESNATAFYAYENFGARSFGPSGSLDDSLGWGLYDVPGSVMEWLADLSPLGDGKTYGLAASGSYTQVAFGWRDYAPYAEYPAGSWARDINRYNHSEIGFRCVMGGAQALHMLNPSCASDAGAPQPPPVSEGGAGAPTDAAATDAGQSSGSVTADASTGVSMGAPAEGSDSSNTLDAGCGCRLIGASSRGEDGRRGDYGVVATGLLAAATMRRRRHGRGYPNGGRSLTSARIMSWCVTLRMTRHRVGRSGE